MWFGVFAHNIIILSGNHEWSTLAGQDFNKTRQRAASGIVQLRYGKGQVEQVGKLVRIGQFGPTS